MYGLDLFSGIGGITLALRQWVRPIAYCEIDRYCQAVLLSRMHDGELPTAPIWDDVRTLRGDMLPVKPDIIYGGFPCQDISVAGRGAGLAGERSGLFFEIARLIGEIRPRFIFLENVPAINLRGQEQVISALTDLGYDCRWTTVSAAEVGANHRRERWFCLAYSVSRRCGETGKRRRLGRVHTWRENNTGEIAESGPEMAHTNGGRGKQNCVTPESRPKGIEQSSSYCQRNEQAEDEQVASWRRPENDVANSARELSRSGLRQDEAESGRRGFADSNCQRCGTANWWSTEPDVGRVAHGVPFRVDRLKSLGNAVVPLQAKVAFERLMRLGL